MSPASYSTLAGTANHETNDAHGVPSPVPNDTTRKFTTFAVE